VAVVGQVPVGVGGEPVVVAAVEHDQVVVGDAPLAEQGAEPVAVDEVVADAVLQVLLPVELDRAGDVALVVGSGVLVDLDQDDVRVGEMLLDPVSGDERGFAAHGVPPIALAGWPVPSVIGWGKPRARPDGGDGGRMTEPEGVWMACCALDERDVATWRRIGLSAFDTAPNACGSCEPPNIAPGVSAACPQSRRHPTAGPPAHPLR
jgi:hypothetical protein